MLSEEAINTTLPVRCVVRLLRLLWGHGLVEPAVVKWTKFYYACANTDQGMYQLVFLVCSLLVRPDKDILLDVFRRFQVHRLTRRQMLDTLKEVHQAFQLTSYYPPMHRKLTERQVCALMYLHFAAGRGWIADQEAEIVNRTTVAHPLKAFDKARNAYTEEK
ncbi:unnamed protein product [Heligmosomoides polygyrus]|uniref:Rab-GAP TBC domain-containing protein n=1 Tax=Heligmosomoides polygyrus TaxID=6339 RepID=A0A183FQE9_HELPZ|nr:unnamed protein product [Heligmosomoides polygyrus]